MDVAIAGSTGLIGSALSAHLLREGHRVIRLVRPQTSGPAAADTVAWDPSAGTVDAGGLEGMDALVNLAGRSMGAKRFTDKEKQRVRESRVRGTAVLARALVGLQRPPSVFVNASAIGFYGNRGDEVLTEESHEGDGFLAELVRDWEAAAKPAADAGIRTVLPRTGIVLAPEGPVLSRLLPLFRIGLGGRLGRGDAWWSWISLEDEVRAITHLLDSDVQGPVNLTAPEPVTNAEFTAVLARVLRRPAFFVAPRFGLRLVFGAEVTDEIIFATQRVLPARLQADGFGFTHPSLEGALRSMLDRPAAGSAPAA